MKNGLNCTQIKKAATKKKIKSRLYSATSTVPTQILTLGNPQYLTIRHTLEALYKDGYRAVFCHWRHARLGPQYPKPQHFNSFTTTDDVNELIKHVHECYPEANIYLVGLSMGG